MRYQDVVEGRFLERPNRFIALVEIEGIAHRCHVKNTGRCRELLLPGVRVVLQRAKSTTRKTGFSLIAVYKGDRLVNMDSQAPNQVIREALDAGDIIRGIALVKPEYTYGDSRFDFCCEAGGETWLIEVKGVTLERDGESYFPDAPTERGLKHIKGLEKALEAGYRTAVIFLVQMEAVAFVAPNDGTHPAFGETLRAAARAGVQVWAWDSKVTPDSLTLNHPVPIRL